MTPTQPPYKLHQWPAHLLVLTACGIAVQALLPSYIQPGHYLPRSATSQYAWPWSALLFLAWLAPVVALGGRMLFRTSWHRPPVLVNLGLLVLVAVTLLSAALSPLASQSLLRIWPTIGGCALLLWLCDWLNEPLTDHRGKVRRLSRGLAAGGALLTIVSLTGWFLQNGGVVWDVRNEYPFGHSIYTAGALILLLPWIVLSAVKTVGRMRLAWGATAGFALLALFSTSSRGGVAALAVIILAVAGLAAWRTPWPATRKAVLVAVSMLILAGAVWSNPRLRELATFGGWSASSQASNDQRSAMLEAGFKLGRQRPLLGWGPGTTPLVYPKIRHDLAGGVDSVLQLHNTPAQVWATLGTGGLLALLLLLIAAVRRSSQLLRAPRLHSSQIAAGSSLLGYALFALTDHQLDVPAITAVFVIITAIFFGPTDKLITAPFTRTAKWYLGLSAGCLLLIPILITARDQWARYAYEQSLTLFARGRTTLALTHLEMAANRAPHDPYYRQQLAGRYLSQRNLTSDAVIREQLGAEAAVQLKRSLSAGCLQEYANCNLAWLALENRQPMEAVLYFLATIEEAPHRAGAYHGLGLALRALGNETAAVRAFALEWVNEPYTFTSPRWELPELAPYRPRVRAEAARLLEEIATDRPEVRSVLALWSWWEDGIMPETGTLAGGTSLFFRLVDAHHQDRPAPPETTATPWNLLYTAWRETPTNPEAFRALLGMDADFLAALRRRAERHPPPHWRDFLTAGLENETALQKKMIVNRPGYGVLARHPDGPVLENLFIQHHHRVAADFTADLFPAKGWISARTLREWLPAQAYRR